MSAGVRLLGAMKYVDDVNLVLSLLDLGSRWRQGTIESREEWRLEDLREGKTRERVTMEVIQTAANEILPWLEFTEDTPCKHESLRVPMLDLQVWVRKADPSKEDDHDVIGWMFYEKPCASHKVLRASSAYGWRSKLVTLNMEVFRRMRNTSRDLTMEARASILKEFIVKMRMSGYVEATVRGVLVSGLNFYTRKLRIELQGGPLLNTRTEHGVVQKRRRKLGATEGWFSRRRGGEKETTMKDHGWTQAQDKAGPRVGGQRGRRTLSKYPNTNLKEKGGPTSNPGPNDGPKTMATLLVPYTMGSRLKEEMQQAEDRFVALVGGSRVRMVEQGGNVMGHLLGRGDPWASGRSCDDASCMTCSSRRWLREEQKSAKKEGRKLPDCLIVKSSHQCRREGLNYSLQCLDCALEGVRSVYWGESGRSARLRHQEHAAGVDRGDVANPLVLHSVECHGGSKPHFLALVNTIESRPLYRAVRESVQIAQMPHGPHGLWTGTEHQPSTSAHIRSCPWWTALHH